MVQQEENHRKRMVSDDNTHKGAAAFAVKFQGKQVQNQGERPTCKHCGKYVHDELNCFEIVGYPKDWSTPWRKSGRGRGRTRWEVGVRMQAEAKGGSLAEKLQT